MIVECINSCLWLAFLANNLVNGKMYFKCSTTYNEVPYSNHAPDLQFRFPKGKLHRLGLINAGTAKQQFFSFDGHEMTVIANNYIPIKPYTTKTVFIGISTNISLYAVSFL